MLKNLVALGHALLDDEYLLPDSFITDLGMQKGGTTLVDQETMQEYCRKANTIFLHPNRNAGGSAANTLYTYVVATQTPGVFVGALGDDPSAEIFVENFSKNNIKTLAPRSKAATGRCMVIITPDGQRTMCTSLAASQDIHLPPQFTQQLTNQCAVYLEGYLLSHDAGLKACTQSLLFAKNLNIPTALTLSDAFIVQVFGQNLQILLAHNLTYLFANATEIACLLGIPHPLKLAEMPQHYEKIKNLAQCVCVTFDAQGSCAVMHDTVVYQPALPNVTAVDSTGAGDAFAGAFLAKHLNGATLQESLQYGNTLAGRLVGQFGARLPHNQFLAQ